MDENELALITAFAERGYVVAIARKYESAGVDDKTALAPHLTAAVIMCAETGQINDLAKLFDMPETQRLLQGGLMQHILDGIAYCIRNDMREQLRGLVDTKYAGLPELVKTAAKGALENLELRRLNRNIALVEPRELVPPAQPANSQRRQRR